MWMQRSGCRLHLHAGYRLAVWLQPKQQLSRPAIVSTEVCQNRKSTSFSSHLRGEWECKREKENYKQTETARHGEKEWKRDSAVEGGLANALAFKLQISNTLPDIERERRCMQLISANTNIGNGSKMEFTQAHRCTVNCQETLRPKSGGLEWQNGGGEWGSRFLFESKAIHSRPAGRMAATGRKAPCWRMTVCCLGTAQWRNNTEELPDNEYETERKWERSGSFCVCGEKLPKQFVLWGTKVLQAVAISCSAPIMALMMRSSTCLINTGTERIETCNDLKSHTEPPLLHLPCVMVKILNVGGTKWSPFQPIAQRVEPADWWKWGLRSRAQTLNFTKISYTWLRLCYGTVVCDWSLSNVALSH